MLEEKRLTFRYLLTPQGWLRDQALVVDAEGMIRDIEPASGPWTGTLALPGIPNAHSHVFQRALAGRGEAHRGGDSFWSWRREMYRLAARLDAEDLYVIARYAYGEMLAAGFTSVAEFHYLHHAPDGARGPEMAEAVIAAARDAGIRLRLIPVLYQRGGFDRVAQPEQARFIHSRVKEFLDLLAALAPYRPGLGFHSLRAVAPQTIAQALPVARRVIGDSVPVHIHIAEQRLEVEQCRKASGNTPVEILLDAVAVDERWALVHATHATAAEFERLAGRGACVVICPITEACLGDGVPGLKPWIEAGGALALGSDANTRLDAVEEMRWLEYGQRLARETRACLADGTGLGAALWRRIAAGGAQALQLPLGALAPGRAADLLVLEADATALRGHAPPGWVDALVIGGSRADVAAVYVGGRRVVEGGAWPGQGEVTHRYHDRMIQLLESR